MLALKAEKFAKPLSEVMNVDLFAVLAVSPVYAYDKDKKRTDTIIGTRYTVANPDTFVNFDIKVNNPVPVVTQDQVETSDERFWVSFVNAMVKPYAIEYGNIQCAVTADSVKLDSGI